MKLFDQLCCMAETWCLKEIEIRILRRTVKATATSICGVVLTG